MLRYYITNRKLAGGFQGLVPHIERALDAGVDMIQIREKDAPVRELVDFVRRVLALPNCHSTKILVNERLDIALAAGAHGVHLPANSIPPALLRPYTPKGFVFGVSTHEARETADAEEAGADFVVYGPVFSPLSKATDIPPRGIEDLRTVCASVKIPVLALGGVTETNASLCEMAGAAGIAGITMFQGGRAGRARL